jgi:hypothetical protein
LAAMCVDKSTSNEDDALTEMCGQIDWQ